MPCSSVSASTLLQRQNPPRLHELNHRSCVCLLPLPDAVTPKHARKSTAERSTHAMATDGVASSSSRVSAKLQLK